MGRMREAALISTHPSWAGLTVGFAPFPVEMITP
jgi:hypothetical protein